MPQSKSARSLCRVSNCAPSRVYRMFWVLPSVTTRRSSSTFAWSIPTANTVTPGRHTRQQICLNEQRADFFGLVCGVYKVSVRRPRYKNTVYIHFCDWNIETKLPSWSQLQWSSSCRQLHSVSLSFIVQMIVPAHLKPWDHWLREWGCQLIFCQRWSRQHQGPSASAQTWWSEGIVWWMSLPHLQRETDNIRTTETQTYTDTYWAGTDMKFTKDSKRTTPGRTERNTDRCYSLGFHQRVWTRSLEEACQICHGDSAGTIFWVCNRIPQLPSERGRK